MTGTPSFPPPDGTVATMTPPRARASAGVAQGERARAPASKSRRRWMRGLTPGKLHEGVHEFLVKIPSRRIVFGSGSVTHSTLSGEADFPHLQQVEDLVCACSRIPTLLVRTQTGSKDVIP